MVVKYTLTLALNFASAHSPRSSVSKVVSYPVNILKAGEKGSSHDSFITAVQYLPKICTVQTFLDSMPDPVSELLIYSYIQDWQCQ